MKTTKVNIESMDVALSAHTLTDNTGNIARSGIHPGMWIVVDGEVMRVSKVFENGIEIDPETFRGWPNRQKWPVHIKGESNVFFNHA